MYSCGCFSSWYLAGNPTPGLNKLAESLPVVVLSSRAPTTATKYAGAFLRWKKWAINRRGIELFPAKPLSVAL